MLRHSKWGPLPSVCSGEVMDIVYLGLVVLFFVLVCGVVYAADALRKPT